MSDGLEKVVTAKLTGTWEGDGVGGKNIQTKILIRGHISTTTSWQIGLTSISNKPEVRGGDGRRGNSLALENPTY